MCFITRKNQNQNGNVLHLNQPYLCHTHKLSSIIEMAHIINFVLIHNMCKYFQETQEEH